MLGDRVAGRAPTQREEPDGADAAMRGVLRSPQRTWPLSNCYVDLWIELLVARALDPLPLMVCVLGSRFEGDQWTFCKPNASEIATLYGIRVEELHVWSTLLLNVDAQIQRGRVVLLEADAFHLPDTLSTSYRQLHGKTTIGVHSLSMERRELHYWHNAGFYSAADCDFDGIFAPAGTALPMFAELVDFDAQTMLSPHELRSRAAALAARRWPGQKGGFGAGFSEWAECAEREVRAIANDGDGYFHAWAFANVRQAGAAHELLAHWCRFMGDESHWQRAATHADDIARALAVQQFRLARAAAGGRAPDFADALRRCALNARVAYEAIAQGLDACHTR